MHRFLVVHGIRAKDFIASLKAHGEIICEAKVAKRRLQVLAEWCTEYRRKWAACNPALHLYSWFPRQLTQLRQDC